MTERSISTGDTPNVIIRARTDATVEGSDGQQVTAIADGRHGLKVEAKRGGIEISADESCVVRVPIGSSIKVYTGKAARVRAIHGRGPVFAGPAAVLDDVHVLANLTAGGKVSLDCERVESDDAKFAAGHDFRCRVRDLSNTTVQIDDIRGPCEMAFGNGRRHIRLKAGGD